MEQEVVKFDIKLKSKPKDGVILQLHHTIRDSRGECKRIRFSVAVFDDLQEKLACSDNAGNLFILDFCDLKFWKLSKREMSTSMHFVPNKNDNLVFATIKNFDIKLLDVNTGRTILTLSGHTNHVKHLSFSKNKMNNLLTASNSEAILWELKNYTKFFTLSTNLGSQIQQIMFTPAGEYLVACFQNDTVQIWRHDTMKSAKQIISSGVKHLKSIAFTMNGRALAMAGLVPLLILFSMDTWKAIKYIDLTKYNVKGVHQIAFIPEMFDGGANKLLGILSSDCVLYLLNLETLEIVHSICPETSSIKRFVVSPMGKYFLCILQHGEVNIYNTSLVLETTEPKLLKIEDSEKKVIAGTSVHTNRCKTFYNTPNKMEIEQKMRTCMDSARLRRILMQYGEYPDKFRSIIWKSLLNTPRNKVAYSCLVDKGIHPSYKNIEKQFTIHSTVTLKNLKRLLSCLAHWCPLFGVMKFLPGFVFPFVKVLQKDPLLLFECVATILINQCQLWFEYAPFPPISILAMAENVLAEHDHQLLDHFCQIGVTSQTYALKMLETAFSEVLPCPEWLILWDHILSNEPSFILMAVVAYNTVQKNVIKRFKSHEQVEHFFCLQNPIDSKALLKKAYLLLHETSEDVHPRKYFNGFIPLEKGSCYQQFTGYPKATICLKLANKEQKKSSANRHTLRELTTKCQEKIINELCKSTLHSDDNNEEHYIRDRCFKKHRRKSNIIREKGEGTSNVKKELIESIYFPPEIHLRHKGESALKNSRPQRGTAQVKLKKSLEKVQTLENEVENLMKSCTDSDVSD